MLNALDDYVLKLAATLAQRSPIFDEFVVNVLFTSTFKMVPLVICLWAVWFAQARQDARLKAITTIFAGVVAMTVSRLIQNLSPERARPIHSGNPDYVMPIGMNPDVLRDWSSFPSDSAALSMALAVGIFSASRRMGLFCILWALTVVCLPRIYGGLHYASDILGGLVIGVISYGACMLFRKLSERILVTAEAIERNHPPVFYGALFFCSYQLATMFTDIRAIARFLCASII